MCPSLVAWLASSRANLITGGPLYRKSHLLTADADGTIGTVKTRSRHRAVARIEWLMKR